MSHFNNFPANDLLSYSSPLPAADQFANAVGRFFAHDEQQLLNEHRRELLAVMVRGAQLRQSSVTYSVNAHNGRFLPLLTNELRAAGYDVVTGMPGRMFLRVTLPTAPGVASHQL